MKRLLCLFLLTTAVVAGSLVLFSPKASAITYGFVDSNNTFRNTGAFIVKDLSDLLRFDDHVERVSDREPLHDFLRAGSCARGFSGLRESRPVDTVWIFDQQQNGVAGSEARRYESELQSKPE
jgi:hypothetical protein